ncbi:MAG: hypothetical protein AUI15_07340 [Actinobacteria bacterium 13_2_20CM_2_66_6]|nr:MAG: hypothetical protein AUI15_07340 [Actinobacteria bacterium 13_2_20CM_2_66_6]TME91253.1 MAG: DUF1292 domain-containing protein [Chloroflexota bacterium]
MSPPGAPEPSEEVTLIGEDGRERTFRLHDAFDLEGATYYLVEGADNPSEVLLLREVDGGLETVEDDEFQRVMSALDQDLVD